MSKWKLFSLLAHRDSVPSRILTTRGVIEGIVTSVEREDGSGCCFNVTLLVDGGARRTVFVRTVD